MNRIFDDLDRSLRIQRIRFGKLFGKRPKSAGCNARLGEHGIDVEVPLIELQIGGTQGFGWSRLTREEAQSLIGRSLEDILHENNYDALVRKIEFPLLDWLGKLKNVPVYELFNSQGKIGDGELIAECYDTSFYINDLHLDSDESAVKLIQEEIQQSLNQGHRAFKIKIGRGARWMPPEIGMRRDIAVVNGVRSILGEGPVLLVDANNGFNLNLTKVFLEETGGSCLTWMEEPFHEDPELFLDLKNWLREQQLPVMLADGEGAAAPNLVEWAEKKLLDVVQYDLRDYGFLNWVALGDKLDLRQIKSAPHNYGGVYGNYAACHLAPLIQHFTFVEWDEAEVPGLDRSGYRIHDGKVHVSALPGFGLGLDQSIFQQAVDSKGWELHSQ